MSKVLVTQVPSRYDKASEQWTPTVDITSATEFGEIVELLPPNAGWFTDDVIHQKLTESLNKHRFVYSDYLLLLGSPVVMTAAVAIISRLIYPQPIRLLVWDRMSSRYVEHKVRA